MQRLISEEFRIHYKRHVFQCILIFLSLGAILSAHSFFAKITVASLGATAFIIFAVPHADSARTSHVVGGYFCGAASGLAFNLIFGGVLLTLSGKAYEYSAIFTCAGSAALAALLMAATGMAHPPAAALALGLVLDSRPLQTAAAAIIGASALCAVRSILAKHLITLIKDNSDNAGQQPEPPETPESEQQ